MELQGLVLLIAAIIVSFYVLPYLSRRRHVLSHTPLDEGKSQEIRILRLDENRRLHREDNTRGHGSVLIGRSEVTMSQHNTTDKRQSVRALARERARRRGRIARRETNRTRGLIGGGVFSVLTVLLWVLVGFLSIPVALPILLTVLSAVYISGLFYLVREMNKANENDLAYIDELDMQLNELHGISRKSARERAVQRVNTGTPAAQTADKKHTVGAAKYARGYSVKHTSGGTESAQHTIVSESVFNSLASSEESSSSQEPSTCHARDMADTKKTKNAAAPRMSGEKSLNIPSATAAAVPSYTLKHPGMPQRHTTVVEAHKQGETQKVVSERSPVRIRREIEPYMPPAMPEADVPYRPKELGERLDTVFRNAEEDASRENVQSKQSLSGGSALDDMLARRRA